MAKILDGKAVSDEIKQELKQRTIAFEALFGFRPGLAVVLVGTDPASKVYVNNKRNSCLELNYNSFVYELPESTSEEDLLALVDQLNGREDVHGILVQLPLPKHINGDKVVRAIDSTKDVDSFHPYNVGQLMLGTPSFLPCTPAGVMELLKRTGIDPAGKECVVVGRSSLAGKPLAMLLLQANGTVTICHSKTKDLKEVCRRADILAVAVGKPKFITADMVKPGAVVIDIGINRVDGKLCGDVDFDSVKEVAAAITPTPGGTGATTIAMLMKNTFEAALFAASKKSSGEFTYNI